MNALERFLRFYSQNGHCGSETFEILQKALCIICYLIKDCLIRLIVWLSKDALKNVRT